MGNISDLRLRVEGMDCAGCAVKIEGAVSRLGGVREVAVNVGQGSVLVRAESMPPTAAITQVIERLGYRVLAPTTPTPQSADGAVPSAAPAVRGERADKAWWQSEKARYVFAAGLLLALAFASTALWPQLRPWPFPGATLVALVPVGTRAVRAATTGEFFTIEMLMTVAAVGALVIEAAEEAAVVVLLFAVGELLEGIAAARARRSISALADLTPKVAQLVTPAGLSEVPAESLQPGQVVLVRPGDRVPGDGTILEGEGEVNEAAVTG